MGNFMIYQDGLETIFLQLFAHPEHSEYFSIISVIIFGVNIFLRNKNMDIIGNDFFGFIEDSFALMSFTIPLPSRCSSDLDFRIF